MMVSGMQIATGMIIHMKVIQCWSSGQAVVRSFCKKYFKCL